MEELDKIKQDKNKLLVIGGILHSRRAFVGPEVVHVDLTNWCNFNCIACWCRSTLLEEKAMPDWERKLILPLDLLKGVFDDLAQMTEAKQRNNRLYRTLMLSILYNNHLDWNLLLPFLL